MFQRAVGGNNRCFSVTSFMVFCLFCTESCFATLLDREAEYARIREKLKEIKEDEREDYLIGLVVDAREDKERYIKEMGKVENAEDFHFKIGRVTAMRDRAEHFAECYLVKCYYGKPLRSERVVGEAFRRLFAQQCTKWKTKAVNEELTSMGSNMLTYLNETNVTIDQFIEEETETFQECYRFIKLYKKYCIEKLNEDTCKSHLRTAPVIHKNVKYVFDKVYENNEDYI